MSAFLHILPWLLALFFLVIVLIILWRRQGDLRLTLATSKGNEQRLSQELALLEQQLATLATEGQRAQGENSARITDLLAERERLQQENKNLTAQVSNIKAELAALGGVERRLAEVNHELQESQRRLEDLRQDKSDVDRQLSSLSAQMEEERKSSDEQRLLRERAEAETLQGRDLRLAELRGENEDLKRQCEELRHENKNISRDFAALESKGEQERQASLDKIKLLEETEGRLTKEFENLANRIFEEKQQKFNEVSSQNIKTIISPMRQQLQEFRQKVADVYDKENKERASLRTEIAQLKSLNERIGVDALNLTKALKGDTKLRGNWGEMQLERLLEESGLSKGREYEVQVSLKDDEGGRFQPDVVVHLPENKDVVIDAKVSLVAYEQYHSAEKEEERQRCLASHLQSLRRHFAGLSVKNYDELVGVNSLDLVIMFVPIEPALLLAFEYEPGLFTEAFNRHILLVSPSTLMATLQIINNIWRHEYQNRNTLKIATDAGRLHDQFVLFVEALDDVGHKLAKASDSYHLARKRLISGRGNLVKRTEDLEKLGAKTKKKLDQQLLDEADA